MEAAAWSMKVKLSSLPGALKELDRGLIQDGDHVWLRNFVYYQNNLPLNPKNNCHAGILNRIHEHKSVSAKILQLLQKKKKTSTYLAPSEELGSSIGNSKGNSNSNIDNFDDFWKAYPKCSRKVGLKKCREWFAKNKPDTETVAKIVHTLSVQAKSKDWQKEHGAWIPMPLTWLNRGDWEGDIVADTKPSAKKQTCCVPGCKNESSSIISGQGFCPDHPASEWRHKQ